MDDRRSLLRWLAAGGFGWWSAHVWAAGQQPQPPGFRQLRGAVSVNGAPAHLGRVVLPGDTVTTGPDGEAVYVMGREAYLVRGGSTVDHSMAGAKAVLRVITGRVLSVFGPGERELQTATATIGIRGTACYIESQPERVYFCLCYGTAVVTPLADPAQVMTLQTTYHDSPYFIDAKAQGTWMSGAAVLNHTDAELIMLEALQARRPPFLVPGYESRY